MRICVVLDCEREVSLPVQYNHIVQGFLYNNLSDNMYREFMHHTGYGNGRRRFKLFTYSRLLGEFVMGQNGYISFKPPVKLVVSSPLVPFVTDLADTLMKSRSAFIGNNPVEVSSIQVHREVDFGSRVQIKMLSPMVAYTTVLRDGKKFTQYHSPWNDKFEDITRNNLLSKYEVLNGHRPDNSEFRVIPNGHRENDYVKILRYKGTVIKAYAGIYWLMGNPELIKVAYDTGLGSKNSQGFGCWDLVG